MNGSIAQRSIQRDDFVSLTQISVVDKSERLFDALGNNGKVFLWRRQLQLPLFQCKHDLLSISEDLIDEIC